MAARKKKPPSAWLQLLRAPNLLTVPGDPLLGYVLAVGRATDVTPILMLAAAASGALLYGAGLIVNDLVDYDEDRRDRPERPLPSGRIPCEAARHAAALGAGGGLALAFSCGLRSLLVAALLLALSLLYNFRLKRRPLWGPIAMGGCRGLNLLLGAAAAGRPLAADALTAAALLALYIVTISLIARRETEARYPGIICLLPTAVLAGAGVVMTVEAGNWWLALPPLLLLPAVREAALINMRLRADPAHYLPLAIGAWLGLLPILQGAYLIAFRKDRAALIAVVALLLLAWWNKRLRTKYYAS